MKNIVQVDNINNSVAGAQSQNTYIMDCQVCEWYGHPVEKIIVVYEGIRPEDEDGFIDRLTEYDAQAGRKGAKHIHKYKPELVQELVDLALELRNSSGEHQQ